MLGNLTLTADNAQLSNNQFKRKLDLLERSSLEMNRRIAATTRCGKEEILARANDLAERAIAIWPGPLPGSNLPEGRDWRVLGKALAQLPAGSWTTYGDAAALIGSHPVPVGVRLSTVRVPNAHRVLTSEGRVSPGFHWMDRAIHATCGTFCAVRASTLTLVATPIPGSVSMPPSSPLSSA